MNFKIDENLPLEFIDLLREAGHDAVSVLDQQLGGADDSTVAARCRQEHRVLITLDLDTGSSDLWVCILYLSVFY